MTTIRVETLPATWDDARDLRSSASPPASSPPTLLRRPASCSPATTTRPLTRSQHLPPVTSHAARPHATRARARAVPVRVRRTR
jgi:hypothetical protein